MQANQKEKNLIVSETSRTVSASLQIYYSNNTF